MSILLSDLLAQKAQITSPPAAGAYFEQEVEPVTTVPGAEWFRPSTGETFIYRQSAGGFVLSDAASAFNAVGDGVSVDAGVLNADILELPII